MIRKPKESNRNLKLRDEEKGDEEKGDESKEETKDFQIIDLKNEIKVLKDELRMSQDVRDKSDKYADLLNDLFHKGIIDEETKLY